MVVKDIVDTGTQVATDTSNIDNDRGPQETELGTPEACLIPIPKLVTESKNDNETKPNKGEKFFIHSAHVEKEILLDVNITTLDTHSTISIKGLLDCRATGLFIDRKFVCRNSLKTRVLSELIKVYNIDGMLNQGGSITEEVTLMLSHKGHKEKAVFEICDLGKATLIIGQPWLYKHNPEIDW